MSEPTKKKPGKVPVGALVYGALGAAALVRAFWNPNRAVIKNGFSTSCEGSAKCSPYVTLESGDGSSPLYAAARGKVMRAQGDSIWIIPKREAVVLEYVGAGMQIMVREGEMVWQGQQIAQASGVKFAVFRIDGPGKFTPLSPSAWLAARGLRLSSKKHNVTAEGDNWCEGGRHLEVPEQVFQCGIRLPQPSAVALLPIQVTTR